MAPLEQKVRSSPRRQFNTTKVNSVGSRTPSMGRNSFKSPKKGTVRKPPEKSLGREVVQKDINASTLSSAKKRRGPRPAHSGVPVPDKMRKLLEKLNKETELEHQPKTPLKSSMVLKTLTPRAKEKFPILREKMLPNKNIAHKMTTTSRREAKPAHSGVPVPDKMRRLIDKNHSQ